MPEEPVWHHPIPAAVGVVEHDGRVLLIRRRNPPDAGMWGFPGGKIAFGESVRAAAMRELHEETGIWASPGRVLTAIDVIHPGGQNHGPMHYVLIAIKCHWMSGRPRPGDDAMDVGWFTPEMIEHAEAVTSYQVAGVAALAVGRRLR